MEGKTLRLPSPSHPLHSHTDIKIHSTHNHMAIGHPTTGTCPSTREPGARTPLDLGLLLTAFMHLELLDDDVSDLLGALGVRRLVLIELVVRGSRGGAGDHGPDEVHGSSGERSAGDAKEEPDDDHEDVPGALLGPRGGVREIGAVDPDVGGDGVEVVVVTVAVGDVRTETADTEDGDDCSDMRGAEVVGYSVVASAGVGVGAEGDEEGVARPRVGSEEGRSDNGEDQEGEAGGHGGGEEPDLCLGKGLPRRK